MLSFFRINDPYRIIGLLFIIIIIHLPALVQPSELTKPELKSILVGERVHETALLYVNVWDSTPPLAALFFGFTDMVFGKTMTAYHLVSILLIFLQAAFFSIILIQSRAFNESTYVPGIVYALLFFFSPDTIVLSPVLVALPLLLLALNNIFGLLAFRLHRDETFLNTGVLLSITSLLDFSLIVFFFYTVLVLSIFTRLGFRKFLLLLFGFLLPHLLLNTIYFLNDHLDLLWSNFYLPNLWAEHVSYMSARGMLYISSVPLVFLLFSIFWLGRGGRFTNYQSQLAQLMWLWLLFAAIQILYAREVRPQALVILVPPFAFFIAHYFLLIRRKKIAGIVFWIFFSSVLSMNLLSRYGLITSISYEELFVKETKHDTATSGKRILLLGPDADVYKKASPGSPFLDWRISKRIFEGPTTYESVLLLNKTFNEELPEVIVDENNLMNPFFEKLPHHKGNYQKKGDYYLLVKP